MEKKLSYKILAGAFWVSLFLPFLAVKKTEHNCLYDTCYKIFNNDHLGMCVDKAIENLAYGIALVWWFASIGSLMVISTDKETTSPYVVLGLLILISIWVVFVDPARWMLIPAELISATILIIANSIDRRNAKNEAKKTEE